MQLLVTVNERGALTLPKTARETLGVTRGGQLVLDVAENGRVTLQAGMVVPLEMYSAARIEEFQEVNELPLAEKTLAWKQAP